MAEDNRSYFAMRAREEMDRARSASSPSVIKIHRVMQRAYVEKALVGDRKVRQSEEIG